MKQPEIPDKLIIDKNLNNQFLPFRIVNNQAEQIQFISYSDSVKEKQQKQFEVLSKLDYNNGQVSVRKGKANDIFDFYRNKVSILDQKKSQLAQKNTNENYKTIDQKAVVLRGKLVFLLDQTNVQQLKDKQLLRILKNNNINMKQYLYGDRKKILAKIKEDRLTNQKQLIDSYVEKYIVNQKLGTVQRSNWYFNVKDKIFQDN